MSIENFKIGQLVISKSGRDSGRNFIVIQIIDEDFVLLVDGDLRKIEKPKRKKIKHLRITNKYSDYLIEKIARNEKWTNNMVRQEIEKLCQSPTLGGLDG